MGSLTGNTVDVAIIDDPVKDAMEANSDTYRNRVWEWYNSVLLTRLDNEAQQLLTMTRWHEDDLAGRILKAQPNEWEVIRFPAIKEDDSNPDDPREVGEALWPEKHSYDKIMKQKEMSPATFTALFQQRPSPEEGGIIKPDIWFEKVTHAPQKTVHFIVDTSYTNDKSNDPSAILSYVIDGADLYVTRCISERFEFNNLCNWINDFCMNNGYSSSSTVKIEPKASGKSVVQELRRTTTLNVYELPSPRESKITRAKTKSGFMSSGRVKILNGPWVKSYYQELKSFPNGAHDDKVDVTIYAIDQVQKGNEGGRIVWTSDADGNW